MVVLSVLSRPRVSWKSKVVPFRMLPSIEALPSWFWHQSQDGSASIDGSILNGTTFDFHDTLGLDKTDNTTMGRVWFRWSKTRLVFDYFDSSRSGDTTLSQSFVFDDRLYT